MRLVLLNLQLVTSEVVCHNTEHQLSYKLGYIKYNYCCTYLYSFQWRILGGHWALAPLWQNLFIP